MDNINTDNRYLLFRLGGGLYATSLLAVKRIIEPKRCNRIPCSAEDFMGVIENEGVIVSVFDLRKTFGLPQIESVENVFVIFQQNGRYLAALVDQLEDVVDISEQVLVSGANIASAPKNQFLNGIGKYGDELFNIVDLNKVMTPEYAESFHEQVV